MKCLIADDEPLVLKGTCYEVRELIGEEAEIYLASRGDEAVKYIEENQSEIPEEGVQIAFLDVDMPRMSGIEVAQQIRKISPQTTIVFVTGHSEEEIRARAGRKDVIVITKPINKKCLCETLKKIGFPL